MTSDASLDHNPVVADDDQEPPRPRGRRPQGRGGRARVAVALVAVVGGAVLVQQALPVEVGSDPDDAGVEGDGALVTEEAARPGGAEAVPEPSGDPEPTEVAELPCAPRPFEVVEDPPDGWEQLPPPPLNRAEAELLWTGEQLLQVGGSVADDTPHAHGNVFAYTPVGSDADVGWACLGTGPFGLDEVAAVWTGTSVYVVSRGRAAALLPSGGEWLGLPDPPFSHTPLAFVPAGDEYIAWGDRRGTTSDGAIYDPTAEQWRPMAQAPLSGERGVAVWTGEQLVVVAQGAAAAYDPHGDVWTELPPSELVPQAVAATTTDGVVVAYDVALNAGYYDLADGRWHELPSPPLNPMECFPEAVTLPDGTVVASYCGQIALLDPLSWSWQELDVPEAEEGVPLLWSASPLLVDGTLHLITSGTFGRTDQHWRYQP